MGSHKAVARADAHAPGEVADYIDYAEVAAPSTPASGFVRVYTKSDGKIYIKDDAGTETDLTDATGSAAAWADWSPTYSNLTVGNGTVVERYIQTGGLVIARFEFTLGSTSSIGTDPDVSLPVSAVTSGYTTAVNVVGQAIFLENGVARVYGAMTLVDADTVRPFAWNASGTYLTGSGVTSTVPFTWTDGDIYGFLITYEAA